MHGDFHDRFDYCPASFPAGLRSVRSAQMHLQGDCQKCRLPLVLHGRNELPLLAGCVGNFAVLGLQFVFCSGRPLSFTCMT